MLTRLLRQSGTYTLAGIVGKLSGAVLTVFYVNTAYLPVEDYGYLDTLRAAMMTALLVAGAGLPLGIIRFATSAAVSDDQRAAVPSTALVVVTATGAATALAMWLNAPLLAGLLMGGLAPSPTRAEPVRLLALYVLFKTIADVTYTELRHREKVGWYVSLSAIETAIVLASVIWFLVIQGEGLAGVMKGYLVSSVVIAVGGTAGLLRHVAWRPSWTLVGPMMAFGLPLIVSGLSGRFLYFGDRFVIAQLAGLEANATYGLASQFGSLVYMMLVQGVQLSFTVLGMKALGEPGVGALYRRAFRHVTAMAGWAVLGVGLFASAAARLFATDAAYLAIDRPALLVAGGLGLQGIYVIAVSALYGAGRTRTVAVGVASAALLNLALNVALVPSLGVDGAALATLLSYGVLAVWSGLVAQRIVGTRFPWRAVGLAMTVVASLWLLGEAADGSTLGGLALRVGAFLLYPLTLAAVGIYGRADWEAGHALLRRWRSGTTA